MRITNSKDEVPRFTLKLETRVCVREFAVHLINRWRYEPGMSSHFDLDETNETHQERIENNLKALVASHTTKDLLEVVRDSIISDGTETPHYSVSDNGYSEAVDFLEGLLSRRFTKFGVISQKESA